MEELQTRQNIIIRTSVIGIVVNLLLAGFKAVVGLMSNSIAIVLDAVNNTTDALSSIITIIGAKIAGKKPDKDHPLGHGRSEYISALIVAGIVMYAGITSLVESFRKIIHPEQARYTAATFAVLCVAIITKILLGRYVKRKGEQTGSGALAASGTDALADAAISSGVLITALIYPFRGISLEAYMGVIISGFIIKAGIEMISSTVSDILGRRTDVAISKRIKEIVLSEPNVLGAYDLFVHNYGPEREYASIHIELPDNMTVDKVDLLTRKLTDRVYRETGVILTGVGVYSRNTDIKAEEMRMGVEEVVLKHEWALQMHGFHLDEEKKVIRFDVVMSFDIPHSEGVNILCDELKEKYPDYEPYIVADIDITD